MINWRLRIATWNFLVTDVSIGALAARLKVLCSVPLKGGRLLVAGLEVLVTRT